MKSTTMESKLKEVVVTDIDDLKFGKLYRIESTGCINAINGYVVTLLTRWLSDEEAEEYIDSREPVKDEPVLVILNGGNKDSIAFDYEESKKIKKFVELPSESYIKITQE